MNPTQTPEEERWTQSVLDPVKAKRHLKFQYGLLAVWGILLIVWIIFRAQCGNFALADNWGMYLVFIAAAINILLGIVNNARVIKGKHPLGSKRQ